MNTATTPDTTWAGARPLLLSATLGLSLMLGLPVGATPTAAAAPLMTSATVGAAATAIDGVPAAIVGGRTTMDVAVIDVDAASRTVTVKSADGFLHTVVVSPKVKNLENLKAGDRVRVQYAQALTVNLRKGSGLRSRSESSASAAASEPGQKPAATSTRQVHFVADITKVNARTGEVTVRGTRHTLVLRLRDASVLEGFGVGDQVEGSFSQVLSITSRK